MAKVEVFEYQDSNKITVSLDDGKVFTCHTNNDPAEGVYLIHNTCLHHAILEINALRNGQRMSELIVKIRELEEKVELLESELVSEELEDEVDWDSMEEYLKGEDR